VGAAANGTLRPSRANLAGEHKGGPVDFTETMDRISQGFEIVGVAILVIGFVIALIRAAASYTRRRSIDDGYLALRNFFGRSVLLGLEVLVAADLIRTVAVAPSLQNVLVLGTIVLIRTFLSFSLEVELEGRWPWQAKALEPPRRNGPPDRTAAQAAP
jgi:uncharacterized membrane protein